MADAQKRITKAIGKINSALTYMERGRELNIKTDQAEQRLRNILALLGQVRRASSISLNIQGGLGSAGISLASGVPVPYAPTAFALPEKAQQRLMERLYTQQQLHRQKLVQDEENFEAQQRRKAVLIRRSNRSCSARTQQGKRNGCGVRRKTRRARKQQPGERRKMPA